MSAWVCSPKHIAVLAVRLLEWAKQEPAVHTEELPSVEEFITQLVDLNLASVGYLYDLTPAKAAKEFTGKSRKAFLKEALELGATPLLGAEEYSEAEMWGVAGCYCYQSCEGKCEETVTYRIVSNYKDVLIASCKSRGEQMIGWGI